MKTLLLIRKYCVALFVCLALAFASGNASAQQFASTCSNYVQAQFNGGFNYIQYDEEATTLLYPYSYWYSYPGYELYTSLPFDFIYDSVQYSAGSTLTGYPNGKLAFGSVFNEDDGQAIYPSNVSQFPSLINVWGFSQNYNVYGVFTEVTGNPGSRVFTIEFDGVATYYSGDLEDVQIKLYEGTNAIEFLYGCNGCYAGYPWQGGIGINGSQNNDINAYFAQQYPYYYYYDYEIFTPDLNIRFSPKQVTNVQLSVQPKTLTFGQLSAGTPSAPLCVSVQNTGTFGTLNINSANLVGASDFRIVSRPPSNSYPVGSAAQQYCVVFTPSTSGLRTATLTIASNGQDSGIQVVTMTGVGTVADYTIDSVTPFKKTKTRLGDSLTQYLHIVSTGGSPLFFSSINISGSDGGQYFISHFPVNPLPSGQKDSIGITYVPTLEGRHVATLNLLSNAFTKPTYSVSLQGTGTLPHIVATPPIVLFDSLKEGQTVCKTVDIWNPGSDTLKILSNSLTSNDGDFQYTGLTNENALIPPDNHKTVTICFTPLQQGSRQARLSLRTNIIKTFDTPRRDTAGTVTIDIRGTGVPFGVFATSLSGSSPADSSLVGVQICRNAALKNDGDADILVTGISLSGNDASDFTYSGLPSFPFLLKARSSITFNVCGTPDKQGLLSATATFTGTTSGSPVTGLLSLSIYGIKPCISANPDKLFETTVLPNNGSDSTLCVTITNCGDIPAIYHVSISGVNAAQYTVTPSVSGTVVAKTGTTVFCVKYSPTAVGASPASLDVTADDGSTSVSVPLSGSAGCAVLTNTNPAVPTTGANAKQTFTFTITNSGSFDWTPGQATITGTGASSYTVISVVPDPVPAGGSGIVTVQFNPPAGSEGTTLTAQLAWPSAGPCGSLSGITLNGNSVVNEVSLAATADGFSLDQSYPNPTKGNATFTYSTPRETEVRISLVDLTGKLVRTLITGRVSEGPHTVNFDAAGLASGTYIYMLESGSTRLVKQLILTR